MDRLFSLLRLLLVGGAFSLMGLLKLAGAPWERRWFNAWGLGDEGRRNFGAVETAGAVLLIPPATRRIGALTLAATSVRTTDLEADQGQETLALIRFGLLVLALGVAFGRR
jgi:hypothetical protein